MLVRIFGISTPSYLLIVLSVDRVKFNMMGTRRTFDSPVVRKIYSQVLFADRFVQSISAVYFTDEQDMLKYLCSNM